MSEQNLIDCVGIGDQKAGFPSVGLSYIFKTGLIYSSDYNSWTNSVSLN